MARLASRTWTPNATAHRIARHRIHRKKAPPTQAFEYEPVRRSSSDRHTSTSQRTVLITAGRVSSVSRVRPRTISSCQQPTREDNLNLVMHDCPPVGDPAGGQVVRLAKVSWHGAGSLMDAMPSFGAQSARSAPSCAGSAQRSPVGAVVRFASTLRRTCRNSAAKAVTGF